MFGLVVEELSRVGDQYKSFVHFGFQLMDIDQDGKIGPADLLSAAKESNSSVSSSEVEEMIREFDLDGDGFCKIER